jgi:hypothetical protein
VYTLDLIRQLWHTGALAADANAHLRQFTARLYSTLQADIAALYKEYAQATIPYGPNEDDRAGEEFYHHPARRIIGHWLQGKIKETDEGLNWATGDVPFLEQVDWFRRKTETAIGSWTYLRNSITDLQPHIAEDDRIRFEDQLLFHVELHLSGCQGMLALCESFAAYNEQQYPQAFVLASRSYRAYRKGLETKKRAEHGNWEHFYRADC